MPDRPAPSPVDSPTPLQQRTHDMVSLATMIGAGAILVSSLMSQTSASKSAGTTAPSAVKQPQDHGIAVAEDEEPVSSSEVKQMID